MVVLSSSIVLLFYDVCHDLQMGNCKMVVPINVAKYYIKIGYLELYT
jgi:hypothetical protein